MKLVKHLINGIVTLALVFIFFPVVHVNAEENASLSPADFGEPVNVITYEEEDGVIVTESIYFYSDSSSTLRDKSGSGWYKNEKTKKWSDGTTTYYAQGFFVWGDGEVSVSNCSGGASEVSGITISNAKVIHGTGKYGQLFNNYAYVTYSATFTNPLSISQELSVTIRVSESGNAI